MKPVKIVLCFLLLAGGASLAISGQVKVRGEIAGVVVEDKGEGLPGVEVVLTGTVLQQASLTTVSDAKGNFRFNNLLPGAYDLAFKLQGFSGVEQKGVEVFVGRTTPLRVVMAPGKIEQTVVVRATSPMIEVKTPQRTTNFSRELLQTLPSNRQIYDIVNITAGFFDNSALGTGGVTPQTTFWQGASTTAYRYNGVDVSDTRLGVTANAPVYETIDEIEVVTVGASAEYGNFTGATVNVVTKSGGPQYHGSLNAFYTSSKWRGDNNDLGVDYLPTTIKYDFDVNATVSGPILKDRLYFFLAGGYWGLKNQSYGATTYNTYAQPKYYLKLDWLMNKSNTVSFALNGNPAKNRLLDPGTGQPLTNGGDYLLEFNSLFASWQSVFGSNAFLEVRYAGFLQNYKDWPAFPKDVPYLFDLVSGVNYGYRYMIDRDATRHEVDLNVRYYFDAFASSAHEFVLGLEYENAYDKEDSMRPGGAWLWRLRSPAETWQVRVGDTHTKVTVRRVAAFVQDNFKVGKRLSVNLGLRYDRPLLKALRFAGTFATLDSLSPRLGVSYDLTGDTKTVVRASFGTYHNKVLTQSFTYGLPGKEDEYNYRLYLPGVTINNTDAEIVAMKNQVAKPENLSSLTTYSKPIPMDPDIKLPKTTAFSLGISRQLFDSVSVELDYIYKKDGNFATIVDRTAHTYVPVQWTDSYLGKTITLYNKTDSNPVDYIYSNSEKAWRKHHLVTLNLRKRMTGRWSAMGSLTYQNSRGNVDNDVSDLWGYPTYNFDTDPYYADPMRTGPLGLNRHWQVKFVGTYLLPWGFSVTGDLRWLSGLTWTPYLPGWSAYPYALRPYGYLTAFLETRGSRTGPNSWYLNLNLMKSLRLFGRARLDLIADVFNLFNSSYGVGVYPDPSGIYTVSKKSNFGQPNQLIAPVSLRVGGRLNY